MSDEFTFKLDYPLTQKQIDVITDAELEHTSKILFTTRSGKEVEFVKAPQWIPCEERLPEEDRAYLVTNTQLGYPILEITYWQTDGWQTNGKPIAWMSLPKPYEEEK